MGKKKKERQHQAIQYLPKEEPKYIYILTEKIEKILVVAKLASVFEVHDTFEEAISSFE